jgi:hypothetical protein
MELKYSLTRTEIVLTFLNGLINSPQLLARVLIYCLVLGILAVIMSGAFSGRLTLGDARLIVPWTISAFCFVVVWVFIRAKTAERTLNVTESGISTRIGRLDGRVSWAKVADVKNTDQHVLIVGSSGNSFFIPNRAFSSPDQKLKIISDMNRWRGI